MAGYAEWRTKIAGERNIPVAVLSLGDEFHLQREYLFGEWKVQLEQKQLVLKEYLRKDMAWYEEQIMKTTWFPD